MISIIDNKKYLDIEGLKNILKTLGITNTYETVKYGDTQINAFLEENKEEKSCLYLDAQIKPLKVDTELANGAGIVGGLIVSHTNEPMWNNYGYEPHPIKSVYTDTLQKVALNFWENEKVKDYVKQTIKPYSFNFEEPNKHKVEQVSELFFVFNIKKVLEIGGIDTQFKDFGMGPDLCKRIKEKGGTVLFEPKFKAKFLETKEEGKDKKENHHLEDTIYWYKKHHNIDRETFMKLLYIPEIHEY